MPYDDIAAAYLAPLTTDVRAPELITSSARKLRDCLEPIATLGWWSRPVGERLDARDVDPFAGYVWGRSAALGIPEPAVVVSAFGVFEPSLVIQAYLAGRQALSRAEILDIRAHGAAEALDSLVTKTEADQVSGPLLAALAGLDGLARPLFSGLRGLPLSASAGGRLWQAAEMIREHRGDGHLAVLAVAGVDGVEANLLTEAWCGYPVGEYTATRGFGPEQIDAGRARLQSRGWLDGDGLTADGRQAREKIELATDRSQAPLIDALGSVYEALVERADAISQRVLAAGWFPPDPRKRAAG